jgi:hypothetical protein
MKELGIHPFSFKRRPRGPTARISPERLKILDHAIVDIVRETPGISVTGIEKQVRARGLKYSVAIMEVAVERLLRQRRITRTATPLANNRRTLKHYVK